MFDKLDDLLIRFEEVLNELGEPGVTDNQEHFQKLMKEQSDLQPIVDTYREYKKNKETIQDSLSMLEEEKDEDMREMLKEELSEAKKNVEELEHELKILLLPKDPNDNKNVIVEIRAGAGGDEAALFAAEIYRMYVKYAESRRWKTEMMSLNENGIGGFKEVTFMITGADLRLAVGQQVLADVGLQHTTFGLETLERIVGQFRRQNLGLFAARTGDIERNVIHRNRE